jgi:hypothetical protein
MRGAEAAEHVRFLTERLVRANRIERVEPELVDFLLDALRPFVSGADPHRVRLAAAALEAVDRQNSITRGVLDDHIRRALETYFSLPTPGPGSHTNSPDSRAAARHTKEKQT